MTAPGGVANVTSPAPALSPAIAERRAAPPEISGPENTHRCPRLYLCCDAEALGRTSR